MNNFDDLKSRLPNIRISPTMIVAIAAILIVAGLGWYKTRNLTSGGTETPTSEAAVLQIITTPTPAICSQVSTIASLQEKQDSIGTLYCEITLDNGVLTGYIGTCAESPYQVGTKVSLSVPCP